MMDARHFASKFVLFRHSFPNLLFRLPASPFYHTVKGGLPAAGSFGAAGAAGITPAA